MVTFGICGRPKHPLSEIIPSGHMRKEDKPFSILDELMGLNTTIHHNATNNDTDNDLDTSSFNLDNFINSNRHIDYKVALINSLYSQVEYLRQQSLGKDEVIKLLINKSVESPT